MNEKYKAFLKLVSENKELQEKINEIRKGSPDSEIEADSLIALAAEYGITLTGEDLAPQSKAGLSEDELDAVAGGTCGLMGSDSGCSCIIVGSGRSN